MSSLVESLMSQMMSKDNLSLLSNKAGLDEKSAKSALEIGLPMLLAAMSNKASKSDGSSAIISSISQLSGNNPTDDMASYLGGSGSQGTDILSSILGSSLQPIQQAISKKTGLPASVVGQLLSMALPLLLGSLAKSSTKQNIAADDLSKLLGDQSKMALSSAPEAAVLMDELIAPQEKGGLMGLIKKLFKS